MKAKLFGLVAALFFASTSVGAADNYTVTFDNVLIDSNPNYTVTGSFLFDNTQVSNPSALYGFSNFNVQAVTPYGTFQMNTVWTTNSAFDYLGLGVSDSSSTLALILVFSMTSNGNGTGLNNLNQAAVNGVSLPILPLGSGSDFIPGRFRLNAFCCGPL